MLKKVLIGAGIIVIIVVGYMAYSFMTTKSHSPKDVATYERNGLKISLTYCQPFKKERLIFGKADDGALVPYSEKWRTGANEATEITFNKDLKIKGKLLKAGSYSIYTIPGEKEWTIVFNSKLDYWGAKPGGSPFEEELDVLRVKVPAESMPKELEQLTIDFRKSGKAINLRLRWDKTKVILPLKIS
ncbi:MAG: DUF2911 domain-containing protein [Bacteroidetes bacterium]|nr:DUF2911 domain-containing protein [Bacteroidota bacterium]